MGIIVNTVIDVSASDPKHCFRQSLNRNSALVSRTMNIDKLAQNLTSNYDGVESCPILGECQNLGKWIP